MDLAMNLITRFGPLDLSLQPSGTAGYRDLANSAVEISLADTLVPTASLEDIIRSRRQRAARKTTSRCPRSSGISETDRSDAPTRPCAIRAALGAAAVTSPSASRAPVPACNRISCSETLLHAS
jgi:hypothetical protein